MRSPHNPVSFAVELGYRPTQYATRWGTMSGKGLSRLGYLRKAGLAYKGRDCLWYATPLAVQYMVNYLTYQSDYVEKLTSIAESLSNAIN
jgi:hypothetical protein